MTTLTVTREMLRPLCGLLCPLEFRDESDQLLGMFSPSGEKPTFDQIMATCPYSEEELNRRAAEPVLSTRTTTEILRDLNEKWPIEAAAEDKVRDAATITVSPKLLVSLDGLNSSTEFRGECGRLLGTFEPVRLR
jgi:hypothetical protein